MKLEGSRTEKNLLTALAAECQARQAYMLYMEAARKEGHPLMADFFAEIARNEEEHARAQFELLGKIVDSRSHLESASLGEHHEHTTVYPEFARIAREEGFSEIADFFERTSKVEAMHEEIFNSLLKKMDEQSAPKERTQGHSSVTLVQAMYPQHANRAGNVHGGEILKLMDTAAGVVAARHAHSNVVTAKVEDLNFLRPVHIGELVFVHASLTFTSRTSMEVRVEVETENLATEERLMALTAYFIFVSLDSNGKTQEIPPLLISTEEGERRFAEGRKRYEVRKKGSD